ncbi:MAG: aminotransferase class V-fold PLP-dependent enzyme [Ruminococcaceae bacterium]|nr:aminotransferase class V-fold PLP-dependent enzyme [Oscillospiraceae bacterium]
MIYFDNAATTYPKPAEVIKTVNSAFSLYGANPGRSGHDLSISAATQVYLCREALDRFFNGFGSEYVSFFPNCTYALNTAIKGIIKKGEHIIISSLEHNSVLRPVHKLKEAGFSEYSVFKVGKNNYETIENFKKAFKSNTKLCVVTAVSNVFGNILPIKELSGIAHERGAYFFVDGAQGAGVIELDMKKQGIDCLCLPGHKGLLGPMGTGALLHKNLDFSTIIEGGTGSASFDFSQPRMYPERLESGTLNVPCICGLRKGIEFVEKIGANRIFAKERKLSEAIFNGLKQMPKVTLYQGDYDALLFAPLVSFNVENLHSEQVSAYLNNNGIAVRGGYHCAPLAHISNETESQGAVRISPSIFNGEKDIKNLLNLVRKIAI